MSRYTPPSFERFTHVGEHGRGGSLAGGLLVWVLNRFGEKRGSRVVLFIIIDLILLVPGL